MMIVIVRCFFFFFFNDTATTEIYTLSLHDALPIWYAARYNVTTKIAGQFHERLAPNAFAAQLKRGDECQDRKSTRLNSSHSQISYAVFCLKKKKTTSPSL